MTFFPEWLNGNPIENRLGQNAKLINGALNYGLTRYLLSMSHTVCVHSVCKIKSNFKYFHQVKSGVEKQYGNGRLITSFNFPNQENFFLYGIRKFYKVSSKIAFQATYFSDNPSTLFGTVFYCDAADHTVGVYSFHFKDETNCWIDFTRSSRYHYNYHNGRKPNSDGI